MKSLKPWLSRVDQLQMLRQRGLIIEDDKAAVDYLKRVGYYRLSGYWYPLRAIDQAASTIQGKAVRLDTFEQDCRFEDVVKLYVFDKKLRLLALDALERIEMAVRVDIAHLLGMCNPNAHENPNCLHSNFSKKRIKYGLDTGKTKHEVWLAKYKNMIRRARREPFVEHHLAQYGVLPIWAAIEVWDFGMLSKLFAGMKFADQQTIAAIYNAPDGRTFAAWLRSLNFIRNVSAHHSRLWNINVVDSSPTPIDWPKELNNKRSFFYFCLMQQLMLVICPNSKWGLRVIQLLANDFPTFTNGAISLDDMGTLAEWQQWELWAAQ